MDYVWEGLVQAFGSLSRADPQVLLPAWRSVWISSLAVLIAAGCGLPLGSGLARVAFPGRELVVLLFRGGMAIPTVFVGLLCFSLFSRRGPLGPHEMLYTPGVIVVGEFLLALPIVVSITHGAVRSLDPRVAETAVTLGAGTIRRWLVYLSEARTGVLLAILAAFARCFSELGIAMMVGGNIRHRTRTLATATAMETDKGEFAQGLAMGFLLLVIALIVTAVMVFLSRDQKE